MLANSSNSSNIYNANVSDWLYPIKCYIRIRKHRLSAPIKYIRIYECNIRLGRKSRKHSCNKCSKSKSTENRPVKCDSFNKRYAIIFIFQIINDLLSFLTLLKSSLARIRLISVLNSLERFKRKIIVMQILFLTNFEKNIWIPILKSKNW